MSDTSDFTYTILSETTQDSYKNLDDIDLYSMNEDDMYFHKYSRLIIKFDSVKSELSDLQTKFLHEKFMNNILHEIIQRKCNINYLHNIVLIQNAIRLWIRSREKQTLNNIYEIIFNFCCRIIYRNRFLKQRKSSIKIQTKMRYFLFRKQPLFKAIEKILLNLRTLNQCNNVRCISLLSTSCGQGGAAISQCPVRRNIR